MAAPTLATPPLPPPAQWSATAVRPPEPRSAVTGVWIGIATISMSFAALTSALVVRGSDASDWEWFRLPAILYVNTLILLISSVTLESSRRRLVAVPREPPPVVAPPGIWGLRAAFVLGVMFLAGQIVAWRELAAQGLFLATSPSSSFFYVLTALHSLHVLGGLAGLLYVLARVRRAAGTVPRTAVRAASVYWHFMGALWVYVLLILILRV